VRSGQRAVACAAMTTYELVLLTVHLAVTASMVGLIWFVQVVHYPLFDLVGAEGFSPYESAHRWRTSFVVGPLMGAEMLTAVALVVNPPASLGPMLPLVGVAVLVAVHASTVQLQVPAHNRLNEGHDPEVTARLVRTNWIRTTGWSVRCVLAVVMVVVAVPS